MSSTTKRGQGTLCVHAGTRPDEASGGLVTPIHVSTAHRFPHKELTEAGYPRYHTLPTQLAAADKIVALEGADACFVHSSGLASIAVSLLSFLRSGDHALIQADIYGGTHHFVTAEFPRLGIAFDFVDFSDVSRLREAARPNTRLVYAETPSNPLLGVVDLAAVAEAAREIGAVSVCDNTFATPICQQPLSLGIDIVVHSGTKYLAGHSDLNCGAVACRAAHAERLHETTVNYGPTLNGMDAFLLERGLKTLALRMRRICDNGLAVARWLSAHPRIRHVNYPGLPGHRNHHVAARQMRGFGGMLSFELDGTAAQAEAFAARLTLIPQAVSLGGVESLICFPRLTSHAKMTAAERAAAGISDTLMRLSVGIEDADDIIADLSQALVG